jgi:hypothetical protein
VAPDRIAAAALEYAQALGVVNASPLSLLKSADRKAAVAGQSTPRFSGEASNPAPYSPVSK